MLQKLRSNRLVLSVGPMGTWTWTGPIGPRDQDGPDQSVLEIPLDRVEPILSVRLDSVQNRSVSVGLGRSRSGPDRGCPYLRVTSILAFIAKHTQIRPRMHPQGVRAQQPKTK